MSFLKLSSYEGTETTGKVSQLIGLKEDLQDRSVIIVEDIVDTGYSMNLLLEILRARKPHSLKVCSLLSKPERREINIPIDYLGFEIPNLYVMGYGLDAGGIGRGWTDIVVKVKEE